MVAERAAIGHQGDGTVLGHDGVNAFNSIGRSRAKSIGENCCNGSKTRVQPPRADSTGVFSRIEGGQV